jgi:hypothetical protein
MDVDPPSSQIIFERLVAEAKMSPRGEVRLATLDRTKTACDDIVSGRAADVARRAGADPALFPKSMPWVNPRKVHQYVKFRRRLDGEKQWPGPHETTLKAADLKAYLDARNAEARGFAKLPPKTSRRRKVIEIVSAIQPPSDRDLVIRTIDEACLAKDRFQIAREMIKQIGGIDLDALVDGKWSPPAQTSPNLEPEKKRVLLHLIKRLTDDGLLAEFGLVYDGSRIKMDGGTGATLVPKDAMDLLCALCGSNGQPPPLLDSN